VRFWDSSALIPLFVEQDDAKTQPTNKLRQRALRLLRLHPLSTADALHLAAALVASEENPHTLPFVCSGKRLAEAAAKEGFPVLP